MNPCVHLGAWSLVLCTRASHPRVCFPFARGYGQSENRRILLDHCRRALVISRAARVLHCDGGIGFKWAIAGEKVWT